MMRHYAARQCSAPSVRFNVMTKIKVSARQYYDSLPSSEHLPNDIWTCLPTHNLLRCQRTTGIVITPACDLANAKVDTITYLPVISVRHWLTTTAFLPEIHRHLDRHLCATKITMNWRKTH